MNGLLKENLRLAEGSLLDRAQTQSEQGLAGPRLLSKRITEKLGSGGEVACREFISRLVQKRLG